MQKNEQDLQVEVAYVNDRQSYLLTLSVPHRMSIAEVIEMSGILQQCPEIDMAVNRVGIHSKLREPGDLVSGGDRVEIYRALLADPKDSRRRRASQQKSHSTK